MKKPRLLTNRQVGELQEILNKRQRITIRLTDGELVRIQQAALASDKKLAEFIRRAVLDRAPAVQTGMFDGHPAGRTGGKR
jgi:predicted DNA binding CopG/RHH family protein